MSSVSLVMLRAVLVLHAALAVLQPVMAGIYLSGEADAMTNLHSPIGSTLWMLAILQILVAGIYWRAGGRPVPFWVSTGLLIAEFVQLVLGSTHQVAIHVPLGTLIVTTAVGLAIWSFRPVAKSNRTEVRR